MNAIDPELGKELYAKYMQQRKSGIAAPFFNDPGHDTSVRQGDIWFDLKPEVDAYYIDDDSLVKYAYLISSIDPVEARLIIETQFARSLSAPQRDRRISNLLLAMCALDPDRALAMLDAVKEDIYFDPQWIIQYILMSREERAALDLDNMRPQFLD